MKKRVSFTVDEDVIERLKKVPREVSISEIVNWVLRAMFEDVRPGGMSEEEFIRFMDSDPRGREVRKFLQDKLGPILEKGREVKEKVTQVKQVKKKGYESI